MKKIVNIIAVLFILILGTSIAIGQSQVSDLHLHQKKAEEVSKNIKSIRESIYNKTQEAKINKDTIKYICIYDKLKQLDILIISIQERTIILNESLLYNNLEALNHELNIILLLQDKANQFSKESEYCVGYEFFISKNKSNVTYEISKEVLPENVMEQSLSSFIIEPPACSSCFK